MTPPYPTRSLLNFCFTGLVGALLLAGQPVWAQDGGNVPTVKVRKKKKKVKKVNPNRAARPVKDKYKKPLSWPTYPPAKDTYRQPRSITNSGKVKDDYSPPASKSSSKKVRVADANPRPAPNAEEGNEKPHLPLLDRIFNRYDRYHRQKERYLQSLSIQLSSYQGDMRVRRDRGKVDKSIGSFTGHQKQRRPYIQRKVEKNKAYYMAQYQGGVRVRTPKAQTRYHKKLAAQVHQHEGSIRVKKRFFGDDRHPSVHHLAQKSKTSYRQRERHRRRRIWITQLFKSKEQPQHLKEKVRKPRYDSKESEIWNY